MMVSRVRKLTMNVHANSRQRSCRDRNCKRSGDIRLGSNNDNANILVVSACSHPHHREGYAATPYNANTRRSAVVKCQIMLYQ